MGRPLPTFQQYLPGKFPLTQPPSSQEPLSSSPWTYLFITSSLWSLRCSQNLYPRSSRPFPPEDQFSEPSILQNSVLSEFKCYINSQLALPYQPPTGGIDRLKVAIWVLLRVNDADNIKDLFSTGKIRQLRGADAHRERWSSQPPEYRRTLVATCSRNNIVQGRYARIHAHLQGMEIAQIENANKPALTVVDSCIQCLFYRALV